MSKEIADMQLSTKLLALASILLLTANVYADDVPQVKDPHHPTDANGKPMKPIDFVQKYCAGKPLNEVCVKVQKAVSADSSRGQMPAGY